MRITIEVSPRGHVSIDAGSRIIGMSPYAERAKVIAAHFEGDPKWFLEEETLNLLPTEVEAAIRDALS